ncbi:MAG: hypothetical protein Q9217_002539 [Psora testacea]
MDNKQDQERAHVSGQPATVARNKLGSAQLPKSAFPVPAFQGQWGASSPTTSDEEEIEIQKGSSRSSSIRADVNEGPVDISPYPNSLGSEPGEDLSKIGNFTSLFSINTPEQLTSPSAHRQRSPGFPFGAEKITASGPFLFDSPVPATMAVEREAPNATPHKPAQSPTLKHPNQPEFGKPSPLQNRLQPNNNFNIPKPNKPRPEHHRPAHKAPTSSFQPANELTQENIHPLRPDPLCQPRPGLGDADVYVIPQPTNPPTFDTISRPWPTFNAVNNGAPNYTAPYRYNDQKTVIDLSRAQDLPISDPALLTDGFGAPDPYLYISAEKANENIKALLEGALEDEDDKPRTRGRQKKVVAAVEGLADKLHDLEVEAKSTEGKHEVEEEEGIDDGTVEGLKVKLLPHQVDGVDWMRDKEVGIKKKNGVLPKGGILADDMGLGKTIQSIALMLTNPRPPPSTAASVTDKKTLSTNVGRGTLVVAPLALIKQWEAEIKDKVTDYHRMKVCVHHGPQRTKRFEDLRKFDVVITTYQILVSEHGNSSERDEGPKVGCFGLHWYRVILDEAHTIKNRNAKATQACYALRSEYRWCLTGTPMQNNLDELQSLIKFLKIKPYNDLSIWKDQITRPMSQGRGGVAMKRLQFYLRAFMKRRTKDVLKREGALNPGGHADFKDGASNAFKITARKIEKVTAEFAPDERRFYERLEQRTDKSLEQMMGGQKMNYASALVLLLRLRQACNHPQLVGGNMSDDRDALTTGQSSRSQSSQKSKVADQDIDAMADLLGGMSVQTKQCDVCQIELSRDQVSLGLIRCVECEEDLASQGVGSKKGLKDKKHHSRKQRTEKPGSRRFRSGRPVIQDSDHEAEAECIVPEAHRDNADLGNAGGTDDEDAEGGGESLASSDTDTDDESRINMLGSAEQKINIGTSDEKPDIQVERDDSLTSDEEDDVQPSPTTSAKIRHLLTILCRESPNHKTIVFSQFTSMLDLIEPHLRHSSLKYTRYDGAMRNDAREASLQRLRNESSCRILLCSLKCGSLGLNLTAASRVVILEPFWNPFVEEQAIDRVHRLNQTEDVVVYKLTVNKTVEERILDLQEKKRELANAAIEGKEKVGKLSMKDILNLFKRDAEHDNRHEVDVGLGAKPRILNAHDHTSDIREGGGSGGAGSRRVTPPVMDRPRVAVKEDSIYGRRW